MADTIVKSFVIDTSKAEQNLRSLDAASAATQASLDLLYNQLVQLDQQLNGLDPSSEAFANVNTQIQALETTISNIETGGIQNIGNAIDDIDTAKVKDVGDAIQSIDTGDAARNIENVGDAIEKVVAPVDQLSSATGQLNSELKDTKVDTSNLDAAAGEYKDLAVTQEEVVTSSKSLKAQLRELQVQLANTEPDSQAYVELASQASILKDKISDAAEAVGTQAGSAFERVGNSLGLVTGRIANLDFEGAAEGAKLLAQNITNIKPGDIANGVKGIGSAFASIGKALLTNPIFLIGAAIAAAIIYADELLTLVDGVTDAELEQLDIQKQRAATSKQQLDAIGQQENLLRLQGKSEKEILQLKFNQAQAALNEQKIVIETVKAQRKAQIEAAERNATILEGIITFLTAPLQLILAQLDLVTQTAKDFGVISEETFAKVGNLRDRFNSSVSGLVFDPQKVAEDGDKAIAEQEKIYKDLENQQAGFQLSINQIDTKAADDKKAAREKAAADAKTAADAALKAEQQTAEELEKIRQQELDNELQRINELAAARKKANEDRIATEDSQFALRQELTLTAQQKEIQAAVKLAEDRLKVAGDDAALQKLVTDQREKDIADIIAKYKGQTTTSNAQSNEQQLQDDQNIYQAKLAAVSASFGAISSLATAFGKGDEARAKKAFKISKAASIAQATVDTYKGAQGIFANAAINPKTVLFPAQPYIEAALAVAAGLVNVKNIASQQFQSSATTPSNDSPAPPSVGGGGGGESQPAQFNPLASQFIQNQPEQITPRAFVLAGDVASQQEVREKVQDLARLG
jgi:hypothetical protein